MRTLKTIMQDYEEIISVLRESDDEVERLRSALFDMISELGCRQIMQSAPDFPMLNPENLRRDVSFMWTTGRIVFSKDCVYMTGTNTRLDWSVYFNYTIGKA